MAINRYSQPTQYQGQLYTPPLDMLAKTFDTLQQRYDQNFMIGEEIKNNFIDALPQDRARANELQKQYETQVDEIVNSYGGDYSRASRDLQKMLYKIKKDFGPGGEANAIISNKRALADWQKQHQELVSKGKILGEDLNDAYRYYMNNYQGIGEFDPTTGAYNQLVPETLTEYVNPDELIQNVYKNFKPEKYEISRTIFKDGKQTQVTESREGITPERLYPSFYTALQADPKFTQYVNQMAKYRGLDPDKTNAALNEYVKQRAQDLSYLSQSDIQKSERDPLFLLRERQRLKDASDQKLLSQIEGLYEFNPTTKATTRKPSNLNIDDWRKSGVASDRASRGMISESGLLYPHKPEAILSDRFDKMTLAEAIKDPEFQAKSKVDPVLMEDVMDITMKSLAPDDKKAREVYAAKYGKDKNWTNQFERQALRKYKEAEASVSRHTDVTTPILTPKAEMQLKYKLAEDLGNPASVAVAKLGSSALQRADELGLDASIFVDKDGKLRKDVNVSYNYPGTASPYLGYRVSTPDGEFVIQDQDLKRYAIGEELGNAFRPIFFEGKRRGAPVRIGSAKGQDVYGIPEIRYEDDGYGNLIEQMYFDVNGIKVKGSLMDVYDANMPHLEGAFGAGASKSARDLFPFFNYNTLEEEYDRN